MPVRLVQHLAFLYPPVCRVCSSLYRQFLGIIEQVNDTRRRPSLRWRLPVVSPSPY